MLTTKQKGEVNMSIMGYFQSNGWDELCKIFAEEHPPAKFDKKDEKKYLNNLERKWRSIIRLNTKIRQLEEDNESLQDELDSFKSGTKVNTSEALPKKTLFTLESHRAKVHCVKYYPNANKPWLASCSEDGLVIIWDFSSGKMVKQLRGHKDKSCEWADWSPDGKILATCGEDTFIFLYNTETWEMLGKKIAAHEHTVSCVLFNAKGDYFYSVSRDKTIKKWSAETRKQIKVYNSEEAGHTDWIKKIAFSPDGSQFATCGLDQAITTWNEANGEILWTFRDHENAVEDVFYSCSAKCDANIIDHCLEEEKDKQLAKQKKDELKEDKGGMFLASCSRDKTIMIWAIFNGVCIRVIKGHDTWVRGVNFHPSGRFLISISDDKTIRIWDITKNFRLHFNHENAHESHILCLDWHKAVSSMATGGQNCEIHVWQCK